MGELINNCRYLQMALGAMTLLVVVGVIDTVDHRLRLAEVTAECATLKATFGGKAVSALRTREIRVRLKELRAEVLGAKLATPDIINRYERETLHLLRANDVWVRDADWLEDRQP